MYIACTTVELLILLDDMYVHKICIYVYVKRDITSTVTGHPANWVRAWLSVEGLTGLLKF
jgi:hypothetical protein